MDPFVFLADFLLAFLPPGFAAPQLVDSLQFFISHTPLLFLLLAGMVFAFGLLRSFVDADALREKMARTSGPAGYAIAVALGAATPFCSCSSVPLFMAMVKSRLPVAFAMTFLITSPLINEVGVVMLWAMMGSAITLTYVGLGVVVGVLGGAVMAWRFKSWEEGENGNGSARGEIDKAGPGLSVRARMDFAAGEVREIVGRVWGYLILGTALGAFIHGFIPADLLTALTRADSWFAVPLAVVAGLPVYASDAAIVPVIKALMDKQVVVGTLMAFMMSAVALSLPEMVMLSRVLSRRMLLWFVAYLAVSIMAVGFALNALWG